MKRKDPGLNASENMLLLFSCHIYIYIYYKTLTWIVIL